MAGVSADADDPGSRDARRLSSPVLSGRERELSLLIQAATAPPAVVAVEGEPGIGKSRLSRELLAHPTLEGRLCLVGHCHRLQEPFPLGPFIEALRAIPADWPLASISPAAGALRPMVPQLADRLPPEPSALSDPRAERHRLFRALLELFGVLGPTDLVLEDLHWVDSDSAELLEFLVCQSPANLTLVLTYRRGDLDCPSTVLGMASRSPPETFTAVLSLLPLTRDDVLGLAKGLLATEDLSERLADTLHGLTDGNPFAVTELVRSLRDRQDLILGPGGWALADLCTVEVPPLLRDSILHRAGLLPRDARLVSDAAAVLELPTSEELMTKIAGLSRSRGRKGLSQALSSALVREVEPGLYSLCHPLARQALYEAIPAPERRHLHLRAAQALEAGGDPLALSQLAHHFKAAGRQRQWLRYAERAADASNGDGRAAAQILEEMLSGADLPQATRLRIARKLGDAALFGRVPKDAIAILARTLGEASLPTGVRGELRFCVARLMYLAGDASSGYRQMVQAADELQRRPALAARAMANLAGALPVQGGAAEHLRWAQRALQTSARQADPVATTDALGAHAAILLELGHPAGWQAVEDIPWSATSVDQKLELVRACKYLARATVLLGHYERAESFLAHADRIRNELGHGRFSVGLATVRSRLEWSTGRWDGLERRAQRLVEASADGPVLAGPNELIVAWLLLSRGHVEDAHLRFGSLLSVFEAAEDRSSLASAASGLARIHLSRGHVHAAAEVATLALDASRENGAWTWTYPAAPSAVDALLAKGAITGAHDLATRFARGLRGRDAPAPMAALAFCRGAIGEAEGRHQTAVRRFGQAERAWRRLPCPYEAAQAQERRGRCLLAGGEGTGGDCLLDALEQFDGLGASWDADRVKATLRSHKIALPHPWRGGRRGYGEGLSPREREVARLAGIGRTNREIAGALFISPRTVENHVASALRKLDVTSRTDLGLASESEQN